MPGGYLNEKPPGAARRYLTRGGVFPATQQPRSPLVVQGGAPKARG